MIIIIHPLSIALYLVGNDVPNYPNRYRSVIMYNITIIIMHYVHRLYFIRI